MSSFHRVPVARRRHRRVQGRNPPVSLQSDLREHQGELPLHLPARLQVSRSGTSLRGYVPSSAALIISLLRSAGLNPVSHLGTKGFMLHLQMNSIQPLFTACEAAKRLFFFFNAHAPPLTSLPACSAQTPSFLFVSLHTHSCVQVCLRLLGCTACLRH